MKEMNDTYLNTMYRDVDHMSRLFSLFTVNSEKLCSELQDALAYEDAKAQDIMHCIELKKLDAVQCAKLCHALKENRIKRRKIKDALTVMTGLDKKQPTRKADAFKAIGSYDKARSYVLRTNILKEVLGYEGAEIRKE